MFLADTHDRLIAQVLEHFQKLTRLASIHGDGRPETGQPDTSAVNGLSMQIEFEGLVRQPHSFLCPRSHSGDAGSNLYARPEQLGKRAPDTEPPP